MLALQDKLQGAKTALLDCQSPIKEKFEEQRKELESSKTTMSGYTNEKVNVKRQIQEMRVSSGTGLINLENSTRCLEDQLSIIRQNDRSNRITGHNRVCGNVKITAHRSNRATTTAEQ